MNTSLVLTSAASSYNLNVFCPTLKRSPVVLTVSWLKDSKLKLKRNATSSC